QNILYETLDALTGDASLLGGPQPADTIAYIKNSAVTAHDVTVNAVTTEAINATITNAAQSASSTLYAKKPADVASNAFGGLLASNKLNGSANAYIDESGLDHSLLATPTTPAINATGKVSVTASDAPSMNSNVSLVSSGISTSDAGISVISNSI